MWEVLCLYDNETWDNYSDTPDLLGGQGFLLSEEQVTIICLNIIHGVRHMKEIRFNKVGSTNYTYIGQNLEN